MYLVEIRLRCSAQRAEVDLDAPESTALIIEDCVSRALLELLGPVAVDQVLICGEPGPQAQDDNA